jgi:hypothetical protein
MWRIQIKTIEQLQVTFLPKSAAFFVGHKKKRISLRKNVFQTVPDYDGIIST